MKRHVFRGGCAHAICADCQVEKQWVDEASAHVYRRSPKDPWSKIKPPCIREIPRGIASEGRL